MLLDYGAVVAHVFLREQREFYDLDRLFSDAAHHDPLTGELVTPMVAGADDRASHQDVELGVPGVPVMPTPATATSGAGGPDEPADGVGRGDDVVRPRGQGQGGGA